MMTILSWLFAGAAAKRAMLSDADRAIEEKKRSIEEADQGIEAVQPIVEEAIKRTDDEFYRLRSRIKRAERRKLKTEVDLFTKDLERGWRTNGLHHDDGSR